MKVAYCTYTNRPAKLLAYLSTFRYGTISNAKHQICLSVEDNYTRRDIIDVKERVPSSHKLSIGIRLPKFCDAGNGLFYGAYARTHASKLADPDTNYLIFCDDDFRFSAGTANYPFSTGARYEDAIQYMENNPKCGMVYMKGFLGGANKGREIQKMDHGYFETGCGMVVRKTNRDIIDDVFMLPGAGNDVAIGMTAIMRGYYVAKALNTPLRKDVGKKLWMPNSKSQKNITSHPHYNFDYVMTKGIFGEIARQFGSFKFGGRLPQKLLDMGDYK